MCKSHVFFFYKQFCRFLAHVQEVLNNVCKTEESLRRLKNRNQPVSEDVGQGSGDTISDEKKIREQIKLDISYFVTTVRMAVCANIKELQIMFFSAISSISKHA